MSPFLRVGESKGELPNRGDAYSHLKQFEVRGEMEEMGRGEEFLTRRGFGSEGRRWF